MILPSGCTNSETPTCSGGNDTTTKAWNNATVDYYDVPGCQTLTTTGASKSSQNYRGNVNTNAIIAAASGGAYQAAEYCENMTFGGYSDWYLPSKSELAYAYCKATPAGTHSTSLPQEEQNCVNYGGKESRLNGFVNNFYWSSTEYDTSRGWRQSFGDGNQVILEKFNAFPVRCVRRYFDSNPCPANYVLIPALKDYSSSDFCVAKYEMKNVGGVATSQAAGDPWVSIIRGATETTANGAWKACRDLGNGYNLISNAQWQSIARNIETVESNWSSGTVGSGTINKGHSDAVPNSPLAADADDNNGCSGTGETCDGSTWHSQRRTHTLSNGEIIWDISGNVWEWTKDDYGNLGVNPTITASWQELSGLSATNKALFSSANGTWNSTQGIGQALGGTAGTVLRGGGWNTASPGIFTLNLNRTNTDTQTNGGFRCVFIP